MTCKYIQNQISEIYRLNQELANNIEKQMGSLTKEDISELAKYLPFHKVLVRCGNGRFVTAAQNANWFVEVVNKSNKDYVRDVSLIAE